MLFFVIVSVLLASVKGSFYFDCGSKQAVINSVNVTGCAEDAKECVLKRHTNATFGIDFTPKEEVHAVTAIVHGVIMNLPVPFPLPQPHACKGAGLTCPLPPGQEAKYTTSMPILKSYPKVKVDIKWELKDENEVDLVCIMISARIQ